MTKKNENEFTEGRKRKWDVGIGLVTALLAVAGFLVGISEFNSGERNKLDVEMKSIQEKDRIEFQRKLWLEQLETYRTTADAIGVIAAHAKRGKDFEDQLRNFDKQYWGSMIMVEDKDVERAMANFRNAAQDFRDGYTTNDDLTREADRVVLALKNSVRNDPVAIDLEKHRQEMSGRVDSDYAN